MLPGGPQITGPCILTHGSSCVASPNYPERYGTNEQCDITNLPANPMNVLVFATDGVGSICEYSDAYLSTGLMLMHS